MIKKIRPMQKEIKKSNPLRIGAFDIETHGMFGAYLDGFLKYDDNEKYHRANTMEELFNIILSRWNVTLYAHNANGYEFNYLIDVLKERNDLNISLIIAGNKIIGVIILDKEDKKKRIELRDSLAIMPMSLANACIAYKVEGIKGDIGLSKGVIYDPQNVDHQSYCKNDVWCTIECVKHFTDDMLEVFNCGIGFTAASTALAAFQTTISENTKYFRLPEKVEEFVRSGYYGGLVYPGKSIHKQTDITSVDRNAAYAKCMLEGVPYGKAYYTAIFMEELDGVYNCYVKTPEYTEKFIPIIPYREQGLKWPVGEFETVISSDEIKFAREHGYEIEVIDGMVFSEHIYPFNDFVNKCQEIEVSQPDKKDIIKLCRNSCYGKFGTKLMSDEYVISPNPLTEEWTPLVDEETGEINFSVYTRKVKNNAHYLMPHWALFITAHQRLWMLDMMYKIGAEHIVYGDTDSIKAPTHIIQQAIDNGILDIGKHYGQCKIDEQYEWFQCLGPKVYYGVQKNGKDKMRAKGIPTRHLSMEVFSNAYKEEFKKVEYISSNTALSRLKKPERQMRVEAKRCITNFRNSKSWLVTEDGIILPPTIERENTNG